MKHKILIVFTTIFLIFNQMTIYGNSSENSPSTNKEQASRRSAKTKKAFIQALYLTIATLTILTLYDLRKSETYSLTHFKIKPLNEGGPEFGAISSIPIIYFFALVETFGYQFLIKDEKK